MERSLDLWLFFMVKNDLKIIFRSHFPSKGKLEIREITMFGWCFCSKIGQIKKGKSAFTFMILINFLLNSNPKLVGTPCRAWFKPHLLYSRNNIINSSVNSLLYCPRVVVHYFPIGERGL